jgi:Zn-dependent peptidase ImmA (M78 family)
MSADDVLNECGFSEPPVPVELIPGRFGIQLCQLSGSDDIFGAIVRKAEDVVIAVNPSQHQNRQRFTIAHELGHYFRHPGRSEHVDRDFRIHWRNRESSQGINWEEIEANRFAAELLMPERLLRKDLVGSSALSESVLRTLATRYKVSLVAMKFRLLNLGILPPEWDPTV